MISFQRIFLQSQVFKMLAAALLPLLWALAAAQADEGDHDDGDDDDGDDDAGAGIKCS